MPVMKPGPDSIRIIAISHSCTSVAARACGLVGLEPTRVTKIPKDRPTWFCDCRAVDVLNVLPTANGGTIVLYTYKCYMRQQLWNPVVTFGCYAILLSWMMAAYWYANLKLYFDFQYWDYDLV
ncbi:hypothetical protein ACS0TY_001046 [Phlomoides rotata]